MDIFCIIWDINCCALDKIFYFEEIWNKHQLLMFYCQMVSTMFNTSFENAPFNDTLTLTLCWCYRLLLLWIEIPGTLTSHNCTKDSSPIVSSLVWHSH